MGAVDEWQALSGPARATITALTSWLFFFVASLIVDKTSLFQWSTSGRTWIWKNRCISWLHALIVSALTIYCFLSSVPDFWDKDLVFVLHYHSYMMQLTLALSIGYFFHDLADNLVYTFNGSLEGIAVLAHHVVAIVMFALFTGLDHYCTFVMLAIATEINSVFLHFRKLLQLAGYEITDRIYIVNNVLNVLTFIVCRVGGQLYMKYLIVLATGHAPPVLWIFGLLAMTSLQIVNMALANSLFVSDVKRWRKLQQIRRTSTTEEDTKAISSLTSDSSRLRSVRNGSSNSHHSAE